jgi:membrane protein
MSLIDRVDAFQRRHPVAGFPLAVIYKFFDDQGGYLAALITYYGFLSIVPLLLLATSTLGFLLQGNADLEAWLLDSALTQFPVIGDQLSGSQGLSGSGVAVVIGVVGALYGALGVAQAAQNAMNVAWAIPRNKRPDPFTSRLRSALLLMTAGLAIIATTVLASLLGEATVLGDVIAASAPVLGSIITMVINAAVFAFAFRFLTATDLSVRDVLPGAILASAAWQLLQTAGVAYVENVVADMTATNGVFALVLGLIAWIYVGAVTLVLCVEVNVVRAKRLYPRALMTPFTDDVDLTRADQHAYTEYATAQQTKGFEDIDVDFEHDGQNASARRREGQGEGHGDTREGDR